MKRVKARKDYIVGSLQPRCVERSLHDPRECQRLIAAHGALRVAALRSRVDTEILRADRIFINVGRPGRGA